MPNRPISPTSDDTFQVSPAISSATIPPTNALGSVARMTPVSANDPSARYSSTNTAISAADDRDRQRLRRPLLLFDAAADVDEVPGRQLKT